jgi:hypothetical protein
MSDDTWTEQRMVGLRELGGEGKSRVLGLLGILKGERFNANEAECKAKLRKRKNKQGICKLTIRCC